MVDEDNFITEIGQKVDNISKISGQYIGLMKFQNDAIKKIKSFFTKCQSSYEQNGINILNPCIPFDNSFMTDFLQGLIVEGEKLKAIEIENGWLEFDNIEDYKLYTKKDSYEKINRFYDIDG